MTAQASKPFELHGDPALDLVNTLDNRFSKPNDPAFARPPEELLKTYNDLLRFLTQSELLTESKARELRHLASPATKREQVSQVLYEARAFREHLAAVTYALVDGLEIPKASLAVLDASIKQATVHRRLVSEDTLLTWRWNGTVRDLASPLWLLGQAAADLLLSENASWIRSCAAETCRWLFIDTSKNHTRRWCNMKICGNRMKAHRYHIRTNEQAKIAPAPRNWNRVP
jgi:predicted RNA-binding Zn ribbon-like protein